MFETREGVLKHCSAKKAAELGDIGRRFLERKQPSLEAQIANIADEIAYNNHDVDDGLRYGLIKIGQLREIDLFAEQYANVEKYYPLLTERRRIHETIRRMINRTVVDLIENSLVILQRSGVTSVDDVRNFPSPLISYSEPLKQMSLALKRFLRQNLYAHEQVRGMSESAAEITKDLFHIFMDDPQMLPSQYRAKVQECGLGDNYAKARIIADYIAGMTDRYAMAEHARLVTPITQG
jgi:dGTPase